MSDKLHYLPRQLAHAYRLQQAAEMIEALCAVDPITGEQVSCYKPDPDNPGSYRASERYRQILESHDNE